jgi:hypothetical protein
MGFKNRLCRLVVGVIAGAVIVVGISPVEAAHADAQSGTCAAGWHLGTYTYSFPAYNDYGELMWTITWRKRWCYNLASRRVGSFYAPKPSVAIRSYFGAAWSSKGVVDSDAYYTATDARGVRHPSYPRWGHVSWYKVKMDHCFVKWAICISHYYKVGTISYWDGSKKLILP